MSSLPIPNKLGAARTWVAACLLVALVYAALAFVLYSSVAVRSPGANDYLSRWIGARALFGRGENPYSDAVTQEIQMLMYGRLAHPDEDQVAFAYPLYAAFVAAPLVALPYAQAQALWMAFLVLLLVVCASLLARRAVGTLAPTVVLLAAVCALAFYPSVRGIFLGQYALFAFGCLVLALAAIDRSLDIPTGILVALATVKPQIVILIAPVILTWALANRRWRLVASAIATFGLLVVAALLLTPTWISDFLLAVKRYSEYEPIGPPLETLARWAAPEPLDGMLFLAMTLALVGVTGWRVYQTRSCTWEEYQPTIGLAAIVTAFAAGRIGTPDQIVLLIPWSMWLGGWFAAGRKLLALFGLVVLVAVPWVVFLTTLNGNAEAVAVTLVLPLMTLAAFLIPAYKRWIANEGIRARVDAPAD